VNDLGGDISGEGAGGGPAAAVVAEIVGSGGTAIASTHDVADWEQAAQLVRLAIAEFGGLDVLVNNAGILRDRTLANLSEAEWDAVIRVHLKGSAALTRHAMTFWRDRSKAGAKVNASIVQTTSISGFSANFGQANYAAAKLGVVALSGVAAAEGARYGVRSNAVAPSARTRLALDGTRDGERLFRRPEGSEAFDPWDPMNVSPLIAWLAAADCRATGQIFHLIGKRLRILSLPPIVHEVDADGRWTLDRLDRELEARLVVPTSMERFLEQ
jgi:NAD(P)-dependent dehydrogenase (short-subunit alcohol dehydrogenase family)